MTPGKEGGTWLGLSKLGRIGCLVNLNALEFPSDPSKKGRGSLYFTAQFKTFEKKICFFFR